jgi:hypothetical protein
MGLLGLVLCAISVPAASQADQTVEQRLRELEQQVEALTRRLEMVEQRPAAPASAPAVSAMTAEGVVWTFDDFVNDSPLKVTHKSLDKESGTIDLLLLITAPLPDPDAWTGTGQPIPIALRLRSADGTEARTDFRLERGSRLEPGAHLHVRAQIDPVQAAAARQLLIGHRDASSPR